MSSLVPVKERDFLDQDPPLRGQNYVCLSFISPEEVIQRKSDFFFSQFIRFFSDQMKEFFANLELKYTDEADVIRSIKERYPFVFDTDAITDEFNFFVNSRSQELENSYFEKNNFQTTIRGIKVRGCFETLKEAEVRAQVLKKMDDKFHVYVAEVGCWCPWSPNPDDITNQEYAETQLNTLMKGYQENQQKRDVFYQERKRELSELRHNPPPPPPDLEAEEKDPWSQKVEAAAATENESSIGETDAVAVDVPESQEVDKPSPLPPVVEEEVASTEEAP